MGNRQTWIAMAYNLFLGQSWNMGVASTPFYLKTQRSYLPVKYCCATTPLALMFIGSFKSKTKRSVFHD